MTLQYKFFMINTEDPQETEDELNRFLRSVSAVNVKREFVTHGDNSYWSLYSNLPGRPIRIISEGELFKTQGFHSKR